MLIVKLHIFRFLISLRFIRNDELYFGVVQVPLRQRRSGNMPH